MRKLRLPPASLQKLLLWSCLPLLLLPLTGCQTVPPLPIADLAQPGWDVREGQAVWKRNRSAPEIAGDILVATQGKDRALVQFSKGGLPLLIAQRARDSWEVQIPTQNRRYSGSTRPPSRLILLHLPALLSGSTPPKGWSWQIGRAPLPSTPDSATQPEAQRPASASSQVWRLENPRTGEYLEGFLAQ